MGSPIHCGFNKQNVVQMLEEQSGRQKCLMSEVQSVGIDETFLRDVQSHAKGVILGEMVIAPNTCFKVALPRHFGRTVSGHHDKD